MGLLDHLKITALEYHSIEEHLKTNDLEKITLYQVFKRPGCRLKLKNENYFRNSINLANIHRECISIRNGIIKRKTYLEQLGIKKISADLINGELMVFITDVTPK